jgi:GDSL-like Lipase/Acylhydrolase family
MLVGLAVLLLALGAMAVSAVACGGAESTTLTTKLSGEGKEGEELTVLEGAKVKDKASLSGVNASKAGGTVKYAYYSNNTCTTLVKEAGETTVSSGSVPASSEEEPEGGKTYYWQASYSGDSKNQASTSTCGKEILNVQAKTTLSTTLSGEGKEGEELTVLEGAKVKDKASLGGSHSSNAGGKVVYKVYSDKECKTLVKEAGEVTVSSGSVPASNEVELSGGVSYYWQATYKGDTLHQESKSECGKEIANIQAPTTLSTLLSGEKETAEEIAVVEDASVSDAATLSGTAASMATGTVKYDVYSDSECKDLVAKAGEVTVSGEFVPSSSSETLSPGTYYWQAVYSGDKLNAPSTSACMEVEAVAPEVSTSLSAAGQSGEQLEILEGASVKDTATLHGENASIATGTVKYAIYSDSECKTLVKEAGEMTVSGASVPASSEETLSPGTYYWQASYSGDAHNPAAKSECGAEVVIVTTATSLSTSLSGESKSGENIEVKEGSAVHDTAMLSGTNAATAGGYIEYDVYSDSECKDLVALAGSGEVASGSVPASSEETLPAGTYYWQAVYSGEGVNHSTTSTCGAEKSVVTAPVTTSLSGDSHTGAEIEVEEGDGVKDTATLHGENASIATGTVKYAIYSDSECKTLVKEAGEVTVSGASVPASSEETISPGLYYWQASYSGDAHNPAAKSACGEAVTVVRAELAQYAALGDSFSSGEGAREYYANTNVANNRCHRSKVAYPVRIMEAIYPARPDFVEEDMVYERAPAFVFRACSGTIAKEIWEPSRSREWVEPPGEWAAVAPQKLWLELPRLGEPPTEPNGRIILVTLTIGGNDAGFATIARNCITGPFLPNLGPAACREIIAEWANGVAGGRRTLTTGLGIPSLTTSLPEALKAIHKAAPNARIRIPLYPQILNTAIMGNIPLGGAYTVTNNANRAQSIAVALERFTRELNETIANAVRKWTTENGVDAKVIPATVTALNGHRLGDGTPWVNGVRLPEVESLHPNCQGQLALALAILPSLGLTAGAEWAC